MEITSLIITGEGGPITESPGRSSDGLSTPLPASDLLDPNIDALQFGQTELNLIVQKGKWFFAVSWILTCSIR
jgi:hypothetical protein